MAIISLPNGSEYNTALPWTEQPDSGSYMFGEAICFTDIAIMPFVRQCAHVDLDWFNTNFPDLAEWLQNLKGSELFKSIMPKYDLWVEGEMGTLVTWT